MFVVYKVTYKGLLLPKYYIGSTSKKKIDTGKYFGSVVSKRWKEIFKKEIKENINLFSIEILSSHLTREDALEQERKCHIEFDVVKSTDYFNEAYASINGMFGRDVTGVNNPMFGKIHTKETKEKQRISRGNKKRYEPTDETRKNVSIGRTGKGVGKPLSEEHRAKLSLSCKGKIISEEHKKIISLTHKGKKLSAEQCAQISLAHKGKIVSEETRKKISDANKGYVATEETRKKISEATKGKKMPPLSLEHRLILIKANTGRVKTPEEIEKLKKPRKSQKYICPYCEKTGGGGNMKRYHFENCKEKKEI